jgi:hypothetical protein
MQTLTRILGGGLAVATALIALPLGLSAQDAPSTPDAQSAQVCTAQVVTPAEIEAGAPAVQLTVAMSADVGEVESLEAESGGIAVASPQDLPRIELAADQAPAPITLDAEADELSDALPPPPASILSRDSSSLSSPASIRRGTRAARPRRRGPAPPRDTRSTSLDVLSARGRRRTDQAESGPGASRRGDSGPLAHPPRTPLAAPRKRCGRAATL